MNKDFDIFAKRIKEYKQDIDIMKVIEETFNEMNEQKQKENFKEFMDYFSKCIELNKDVEIYNMEFMVPIKTSTKSGIPCLPFFKIVTSKEGGRIGFGLYSIKKDEKFFIGYIEKNDTYEIFKKRITQKWSEYNQLLINKIINDFKDYDYMFFESYQDKIIEIISEH